MYKNNQQKFTHLKNYLVNSLTFARQYKKYENYNLLPPCRHLRISALCAETLILCKSINRYQ